MSKISEKIILRFVICLHRAHVSEDQLESEEMVSWNISSGPMGAREDLQWIQRLDIILQENLAP